MHEENTSLGGLPDHAARAGAALSDLAHGEAADAAAAIEEGFARAGEAIEASLVRAARSGELAFDAMVRNILVSLASLAIEKLVGGPLATIVGGAVDGAFPGLRADGGPVLPGAAYLVGERGPEVFMPASAGAVETAPGGAVTVNFHFGPGADAAAFARSQGQIATLVARAVARGRRRL
jgi:phage-related minor tail protein